MLSLTASKALLHLEHRCKAQRLPVVVDDDHIWRSNKYESKRHVGISGSSIKVLSYDTHTQHYRGFEPKSLRPKSPTFYDRWF